MRIWQKLRENYVKKNERFLDIRESFLYTLNFQCLTFIEERGEGRGRRKWKRCRACVRVTRFHPATLNAYEPPGTEKESQESRRGPALLVIEQRVDRSIDPGTNLSALFRALVTTPSPLEGRKSGGLDYEEDKKRQWYLERQREREIGGENRRARGRGRRAREGHGFRVASRWWTERKRK